MSEVKIWTSGEIHDAWLRVTRFPPHREVQEWEFVAASDYDRDLAEMRRQRDEALALLKDIEPYVDSLICYASTINEHLPNGFPARIRAVLAPKEPRDG